MTQPPAATTALDRYDRLEAVGIWRETPDAEPREVVVSFGTATLVLADLQDRPVGHWALAGIALVESAPDGTVYAMGEGETLTIRDRDMVEAIAAVARGPIRPPVAAAAKPRRRWIAPLVAAGMLVAIAVAAPRLIRDEAWRFVPPERAVELGDRMLIALIERNGAPCAAAAGMRALDRIAARLDAGDPPHLRVMTLDGVPAAVLPGRTVLIDRGIAATAPDEVPGWAALAIARNPLVAPLAAAGPLATLRFLATGELGEAALGRAAAGALVAPDIAEAPGALVRLASAGLDPEPLEAALAGAPRGQPDAGDPLASICDDR